MSKKLFTLILAAVLAGGTLSGCGAPGSDSDSGQKPGTEAEGSTSEKVVTYAIATDVTSLDPRNASATSTAAVISHLFSTLVRTDENQQIIPDAAESYEVIDDCTYKFTLKKGIKFHDGEELTSEDVKYTLDTIRKEDAAYQLKSDFSFMDCEIIDDYNLYIKTEQPNNSTLLRLNYIKIIPKHYVEEVGDEAFSANPIGSGAYKFAAREKDAFVEMEAFDGYFGEKPSIDRLICKIIPEASARIAALEAGEVDLISGVSTSQVLRLEQTEGIVVETKPTTRIVYFSFNLIKDGPLKDLRVRQALNYAVNKEEIIKGVLDSYGSPIESIGLSIFDGYDSSIKGYSFDLEKAKALLKEAGYSEGLTLELAGDYNGFINGADIAQAVAAQLLEAGIKVTVVEKTNNTLREEYAAGTTSDLTMYSWGGPYNNINLTAKCCFMTGQRASAYSNPEFDKLVQTADAAIEPEAAKIAYSQVQQFIVDEAPGIMMYQQNAIFAHNDRIKGWVPRADEMLLFHTVSLE